MTEIATRDTPAAIEERFRAFTMASSEIIYQMSPDWSEMRHLVGRVFLADTLEPNRTWMQKYIHPDDQPHVHSVIQEAIRTKTVFELEHRVLRADGSLGWVVSRAVPLLDETGEIIEWFGAARDITARKHAEHALRESEQRHRTLFDAIDEGVCIFERLPMRADGRRDYRYLAMNPAMTSMFGIPNLSGRTIRESFPDEVESWYDDYDRVLETGEPIRFVRDSDPQGMALEMFVTRLEDGSGRRLLAVMRDVTERKRHEERQAFLLKLSDALRPLTDPIAIQEAACRVLTEYLHVDAVVVHGELDLARDAFTVTRGHRSDGQCVSGAEELSLAVFEAHAKAWRAGRTLPLHDAELDTSLSERERAGMRLRAVGAMLSTPLLKDGVPVAVMAATSARPHQWRPKDIELLEETANRTWDAVGRARAEAALRASEQATRRAHDLITGITHSTDDLVAALDTDLRYIAFNTAYEHAFDQLFGARIELGMSIDDALAHLPDDRRRTVELWSRALRGETVFDTQELGDPSRVRRFFDLRFGPIRDASGMIVGAGGFASDVTTRVQDEQAVRDAKDQLEEADRRKDEFLAMLGHELRNPLGAIRHAAEIIKRVASEDPRLQRAQTVLERQSSHMTRLIDGLLEVSRIARGKISLDRETIDARDVIESVLQDREQEASERGLLIRHNLPIEPVWIHADHARIVQVLDNLVGNAIKFSHPNTSVDVRLRVEGGQAVICVVDAGIGIRPEMIERLFEPFLQETQELARTAGGLGLGLAVAKGLVELHGGNIAAHSAGLGAGAEFRMSLPLSAAPATRARPPVAPTCQRQILVVEDNPDAGQLLHDLLEMLGHQVDVVERGAEALEALAQSHVDVVLCDLGLPDMSGYDVVRAIRADPALAHTPVVAISGYGQPEDRRRASEAGFTLHLVKPVGLDQLNEVLGSLPLSSVV